MENRIANYHTHTMLCGHAQGMPRDYVKEAQEYDVASLGFSDHCPYPAGSNTWPDIRMSEDMAGDYIKSVRDAASSAPFPIKAGFECEWDKDFEGWYLDALLGTFGADYLVLGPHWVTLGKEHVYALEIQDVKTLGKYIEQTIEGIRSGIFAFVAHPDLFMGKHREWDDDARALSSALIDAAVECSIPLEVNGLGMKRPSIFPSCGERHQYPYLEFWQMVKEKGARCICNSDAHRPQDVIRDALQARHFAESVGVNIITDII